MAANPRRRWVRKLGLFTVLAAGCQTASPSVTRGQSPVPGYPIAPEGPAPTAPATPAAPVIPAAPVTPLPTPTSADTTTPANTNATPASYVVPNAAAMRQFLLTDKPRVKVVAVVGKGNIVTDEEVWQSVRQRPDHRDALTAVDRDQREAEMYRYELKKIIERELLVDDMFAKLKKNKPGAVEEIREYAVKAADRHMREARRRTGLATEKEFEEKALIPQGLSVNVLHRQIERNTIAMEYVRNIVREKIKGIGLGDVHEYYVKNPNKFQSPDRVKWMDVFVAYAKYATPEEAHQQADAIRRQAIAGADFAKLARDHDHGDAAFRNGEGLGQLRGEIRPAELESVVFAMNPGEVNVVQVAAGYHIVKVVEREKAGIRPFNEKCQEDIRDMLFEQMQKSEYTRLTEDLWRRGAVQVVDVP